MMKCEAGDLVIPANIVDVWQQLVDSLAELLSVPSVMINRLEPPDLEVFRSNAGVDNPFPAGTRMDMSGVYCETAARRRQMVRVVDAREDPEWSQSPTAKAGIFAYLGFPLMWPDGEVFGTLCAVDTKSNNWGKRYERLIRILKDAIEVHLALVSTLCALEKSNRELAQTIGEVNTLRGLIPICACCKKIRDDGGYWNQLEGYIERHSCAEFSHSLCPDCMKTLYPDFAVESE